MQKIHLPKRFLPAAALLLILCAPAVVAGQSGRIVPANVPANGPAVVTEFEGATALGLSLRRLGTAKRVLMIAAHPDDESTQILSTLALGQGAEVAYLSLTRGEGGQNGIGSELQEGLGLLRTEELLAARRLDGARQYFTRAYDYGYSRNVEEALSRWPREELLGDVVAVIRRFRPDVVISIFSGTPADGHGQHHAAGSMAREAFRAASDPAFQSGTAAGLPAHAASKLYQALWRGDADAPEHLSTGDLDPLLGRSPFQVAMASRSRHRSQDMGRPEEPGPQRNALRLIDSRGAASDTRLFAGIDTLLSMRATSAGADDAASLLARYEAAVARARAEFNPLYPGRTAARLAESMRPLDDARARLTGVAGHGTLARELDEERVKLSDALAAAAGLRIDAFTASETVVGGAPIEVTVRLWNGGDADIEIHDVRPVVADWQIEALDPARPRLEAGALLSRRFRLTPPAGLPPSEPYFLRQPRSGDLYRWAEADRAFWGEAFGPPLLAARADVTVGSARVAMEREVTYRGVDLRSGEFRRPLRSVPAVTVLLEPAQLLVVAGESSPSTRRMMVRLRNETADPLEGVLRVSVPEGWTAEPERLRVRLAAGGSERTETVSVTPPVNVPPGTGVVTAALDVGDTSFSRGYELIDYPHIEPVPLYRPAEVSVGTLDVRFPADLRIGYVQGAGESTPEALEQLGVSVRFLGPEDLASGDLSGFDAIVTGIRAYEVRPDLVAHNARLLEYARAGGTLVVQYNKYEYLAPGIAPFPVDMARPHDRVTDPAAPVRVLDPDHRAFVWPNRIVAADFDGWVQERGLYHLRSWDDAFTPLLEITDPGEPPQRGSLLVARYGEGVYVYTGLAFFRQLPAGVPGAFRLFANLISLGREVE
jgi:LmbE family N-acetylglucosaminyl deacetylase